MAESNPEHPEETISPPIEETVYQAPLPPKSKGRKLTSVLAIVLLLALIGMAVYWKFLKSEPKAPTNTAANTATTPSTDTKLFSEETESYKASSFGLTIDHPKDWKINDEASDRLTITSPKVELKPKGGQTTAAKVVLTIRKKQAAQPEFDAGNAIAARDSVKISYAKPTASQRAQTYTSFLHYANSTGGEGSLDGIYITGDIGYLKGQAIPKADFIPVEPIISITFTGDCTECTDKDKISLPSSLWDQEDFQKPLQGMLESIVIR